MPEADGIRGWSRPAILSAASAGGVLIAAGGAPLLAWALPWAGVALLHLAFEQAWRGKKPSRRGALTGFAAGFAANAVSMGWAVYLFEEHAYLPRWAAIALSAGLWLAQSLPFTVAGALGAPLMRLLPSKLRMLATPLALVLGGTLGPMFFPWRVGTSQTDFAPLAAWAGWGGVGLVDLFLVLPVVLLVQAMRTHRPEDRWRAVLMLGLVLGGGGLLHARAARDRASAPLAHVGVVHTTFSIAERRDGMRWQANHLGLLAASAALEAQGADVVLWPETAYAFQWPRSRVMDARGVEAVLSHGVHGPLVFGSVTYARGERWNSVVAMGRDHTRIGIIDKRVLMPFSERIPYYEWLEPWHRELPMSLTPAAAPGALDVEGMRIGILNCYEDLSDAHTRWLAELEPSFLSNHTNDAWFGERGADLHLFLSRMRALETGLDLVRVVNGGYSAHVASTGEVLMRRGPSEPGTLLAQVRLGTGRTLFVRLGDWVGAAAMGIYLALLIARWRLRRPAPTERALLSIRN